MFNITELKTIVKALDIALAQVQDDNLIPDLEEAHTLVTIELERRKPR